MSAETLAPRSAVILPGDQSAETYPDAQTRAIRVAGILRSVPSNIRDWQNADPLVDEIAAFCRDTMPVRDEDGPEGARIREVYEGAYVWLGQALSPITRRFVSKYPETTRFANEDMIQEATAQMAVELVPKYQEQKGHFRHFYREIGWTRIDDNYSKNVSQLTTSVHFPDTPTNRHNRTRALRAISYHDVHTYQSTMRPTGIDFDGVKTIEDRTGLVATSSLEHDVVHQEFETRQILGIVIELGKILSPLERAALVGTGIKQMTYAEVGIEQGVDAKSIDNAYERAKRKAKKFLPTQDLAVIF